LNQAHEATPPANILPFNSNRERLRDLVKFDKGKRRWWPENFGRIVGRGYISSNANQGSYEPSPMLATSNTSAVDTNAGLEVNFTGIWMVAAQDLQAIEILRRINKAIKKTCRINFSGL
jgi:hypothetical protein